MVMNAWCDAAAAVRWCDAADAVIAATSHPPLAIFIVQICVCCCIYETNWFAFITHFHTKL